LNLLLFYFTVRFIESVMKMGRINPIPTLKAILYTKKVKIFELRFFTFSFKFLI